MRTLVACVVILGGAVTGTASSAQTQSQPAGGTDVYHVHFTKAAPGHAVALGKALTAPSKTSPMPEHFIVLRHQEGDDWDYVVIQHLGPKAEVTAAAPAAPDPARDLRGWHTDTFVSGPSWDEFTRQMGIGGSAGAASPVYVVGVHRAVTGHREQLEKALIAPGPASSKIETGNLLLTHLEGSEWTFATITRYNSWNDLAADRAGAAANAAGTPGGWADIRQHSAFHRDTIADRLYPAK
jgi:hypothetical protein